jgi:toxin ParE1/3/4
VKVVWSLQSELDLDEIYAFLEYISPRKAFETVNRIVAAADHLGDFPEMGSVAQDSRHYRLRGDHVEVASVEDTRRGEQPDWLR